MSDEDELREDLTQALRPWLSYQDDINPAPKAVDALMPIIRSHIAFTLRSAAALLLFDPPSRRALNAYADEWDEKPRKPPIRQVRLGETFDLAPHEQAEVVMPGNDGRIVFWSIDGGEGGIKGARIG